MKRWVVALLLIVTSGAVVERAARAAQPARPPGRVSVQPFDGECGPELRKQVTRLLRDHGFRVVTSIARVQGTGQYLSLARDHRLAAFVTGDLEERKTRATVTFLVWNGSNGSVLARWSASAAPKRLPKAVAKGFWKRLKQALQDATPPARPEPLDEAPPMFVDAG
jgi:hypothetical protein